jgi:UDP-N-acetyl-D-glucosamine dehydrogenase
VKVGVIGAGYVGLPLSLAAAASGHSVIVFDIDSKRIDDLSSGKSPVDGIKSEDLKNYLEKRVLQFVNTATFLSACEIVVICVPTPLKENDEPDLSALLDAAHSAASNMASGALLINESTSFPGTLREEIAPIFERLRPGELFHFASSPERVDPGNQTWNIQNTPRLVSGLSDKATSLACDFYSSFCSTVNVVSSPEVAEFAKLAENTYRQVNIALANEYAEMCKVFGINPQEMLDAAETKPFGFTRFRSGIGVGGHCIPIDPMYLLHKSKKLGYIPKLINEAQNVNSRRTLSINSMIRREISDSKDSLILLYGLSYKAGVTDLRESPSVELINSLREEGFKVVWFDEKIESWGDELRLDIKELIELNLMLVVHFESSEVVNHFVNKSRVVLDATGRIHGHKKVKSI